MANHVGVNVTKDLACIAVVCSDGSGLLGQMTLTEILMFTFSDGRAFRSVPYFNRWKGEFILHDNSIDEIEFGRSLSDVCDRCCTQIVGFDPTQLKLISRRAVALEKDSPYVLSALRRLNACASTYGGALFQQDSAAQYMWNSLPRERVTITENGCEFETLERVFPKGELVASGRYDIVRAVTNALATKLMVDANDVPWLTEEKAESDRRAEEQRQVEAARRALLAARVREIEEYWESIPATAKVMVSTTPPGMNRNVTQLMTMEKALPMLKGEQATFVSLAPGWEKYAWRGWKQ